MWTARGYAFPLPLGIALSPVTVITCMVLLRARRGPAKTAIFALCWFLAILAAAAPLAAFALVSSAGVLVLLIVAIIGGPRASDGLGRAREWLEADMSSITTVVLIVVGLYFLGRGLAILD